MCAERRDDAPGIAVPHLAAGAIAPGELSFAFSRSGGPGGQNVNKTNTRVTLSFDVGVSPSLTDAERTRIRGALGRRIAGDGVLRIHSSRHRTQLANRQACVERLVDLLAGALAPRKVRRPTRIPAAARRRRLEDKLRLSARKRDRRQQAYE